MYIYLTIYQSAYISIYLSIIQLPPWPQWPESTQIPLLLSAVWAIPALLPLSSDRRGFLNYVKYRLVSTANIFWKNWSFWIITLILWTYTPTPLRKTNHYPWFYFDSLRTYETTETLPTPGSDRSSHLDWFVWELGVFHAHWNKILYYL